MAEQDEESMMTRVAWLYYIQGLIQEDIARQIGCSRTKVVRLLAKARTRGIVHVEFASPFGACFELEGRLKERFKLHEAVVVPSALDEQTNKRGMAKAAAMHLEHLLKEHDVLGAGWGTTVYDVGLQLQEIRHKDLILVQLMGGMNATSGPLNPLEIVKLLATKLGAKGFWLNTPLIVDSAEIKEAILSDVGVRHVLEMANSVNIALVGIGGASEASSLVASNVIRPEVMVNLIRRGAVGDILGQHFDVQGRLVRGGVEERMITFPLGELKKIPTTIAVAGGERKVEAILGALRGGFINVLVSDENTAQRVLTAAESTVAG